MKEISQTLVEKKAAHYTGDKSEDWLNWLKTNLDLYDMVYKTYYNDFVWLNFEKYE